MVVGWWCPKGDKQESEVGVGVGKQAEGLQDNTDKRHMLAAKTHMHINKNTHYPCTHRLPVE